MTIGSLTLAERELCRNIAALAADHIIDDWGEPLKDLPGADTVTPARLKELVQFVADNIVRLGESFR